MHEIELKRAESFLKGVEPTTEIEKAGGKERLIEYQLPEGFIVEYRVKTFIGHKSSYMYFEEGEATLEGIIENLTSHHLDEMQRELELYAWGVKEIGKPDSFSFSGFRILVKDLKTGSLEWLKKSQQTVVLPSIREAVQTAHKEICSKKQTYFIV